MNIVIVGSGPAGIYTAYELVNKLGKNNISNEELLPPKNKHTITIIEKGNSLQTRNCPISNGTSSKCIKCKHCSIMEGFGGAGAFSDGKFNITNDFGGALSEKIGKENSLKLQEEIDEINCNILNKLNIPVGTLFESSDTKFHKICIQNKLQLLNANIRHLGTDKNYKILEYLYNYLIDNNVVFKFNEEVEKITKTNVSNYYITTNKNSYSCDKLVIAVGRSGSHWIQNICKELNIQTKSNRVDIGVRVELPYEVFSDLTEELYESKIVYKTKIYEDFIRTFCMNPGGEVVTENTNGLLTVNGHSYEDKEKHTKNTNFALLVSKQFTEPFNNSNEYAESIIKLSNMLGGGVMVQRFGDLVRGKRTNKDRLLQSTVVPTLKATPGDLSLVLPKRILDDIIEMIYQLDKIAPGTANDDTLLYGVEAKFYNFEASVNEHLMADEGLYIIGDGSGWTHSLSQASASGLFVARGIINV